MLRNFKIPQQGEYQSTLIQKLKKGHCLLSNEVKNKFKEIKPKTIGQALRIDGITPAAVYILLSHVKRKSIKHTA